MLPLLESTVADLFVVDGPASSQTLFTADLLFLTTDKPNSFDRGLLIGRSQSFNTGARDLTILGLPRGRYPSDMSKLLAGRCPVGVC